MHTDLKNVTSSVYGNIFPYNALHAVLYHPFTKTLFEAKTIKWLPIGMICGIQIDGDPSCALMVDTNTVNLDASKAPVTNVPLVGMQLSEENNSIIKDFNTLLPATSFHEFLPPPYHLQEIAKTDALSEKNICETLSLLIDYFDCILFDISS